MRLSRKNFTDFFALRGINKVVKTLILSDVLILGGFGLISPIFAVYVTETIQGGTVEVVGIASTIYLLVKSLGQLISAEIIDRIKGEMDDFWSVFIGSIVMTVVYLAFLFINTPAQLYVVQFISGLATAFTFPSWMAIYTRHIDKKHEGKEWGIYYTLIDLASAGTAAVGGVIAFSLGFKSLFVIVVGIGLLGSYALWFIRDEMHQPKKN